MIYKLWQFSCGSGMSAFVFCWLSSSVFNLEAAESCPFSTTSKTWADETRAFIASSRDCEQATKRSELCAIGASGDLFTVPAAIEICKRGFNLLPTAERDRYEKSVSDCRQATTQQSGSLAQSKAVFCELKAAHNAWKTVRLEKMQLIRKDLEERYLSLLNQQYKASLEEIQGLSGRVLFQYQLDRKFDEEKKELEKLLAKFPHSAQIRVQLLQNALSRKDWNYISEKTPEFSAQFPSEVPLKIFADRAHNLKDQKSDEQKLAWSIETQEILSQWTLLSIRSQQSGAEKK